MALSFTPTLLEIIKKDAERFKDAMAGKDIDSARPYLDDIINNISFYLLGMKVHSITTKKPLTLGDEREIRQLEKVKARFMDLLTAMQQPNLQPGSDGARIYFRFIRLMINLNE